ncbi:hypothetical protein PIB30_097698 [Stylosanthes scabra]|uniref:Uncharacterized protein n=1 Tax=Stylosanthes scabra TaxID=79078 RepID=A0ABU6YX03_9FABA|nr:hypothetical protein [Stylosanthes scabra]
MATRIVASEYNEEKGAVESKSHGPSQGFASGISHIPYFSSNDIVLRNTLSRVAQSAGPANSGCILALASLDHLLSTRVFGNETTLVPIKTARCGHMVSQMIPFACMNKCSCIPHAHAPPATSNSLRRTYALNRTDAVASLGNHNNLDYDSKPERTLFRRRREARRARQAALEQ